MEIKRYIPEITAVGIAEAAAGALAVKRAVEGEPLNPKELATYFGFATFYAGIPAAIIITTAKDAYAYYKGYLSNKKDNQL